MPPEYQFSATYDTLTTRNRSLASGDGVECPSFMVPIRLWDGTVFREPVEFLWDTGCSVGLVSRSLATDCNFRFDPVNDRLDGLVGGLGGGQSGWLTVRYVNFPWLATPTPLAFKFYFIVVEHELPFPLLGIRDVLEQFETFTHGPTDAATLTFDLRPNHAGRPLGRDGRPT